MLNQISKETSGDGYCTIHYYYWREFSLQSFTQDLDFEDGTKSALDLVLS